MDTIPENRSRPYATSPEKTLIYLFLRHRGTGPIFVRKQFSNKKYTSFSLKLSQLITGLVPYFPQIKVSRVKIDFLKLVLPLLWRHS